jgi:hypothetical protein
MNYRMDFCQNCPSDGKAEVEMHTTIERSTGIQQLLVIGKKKDRQEKVNAGGYFKYLTQI